MFTRTYYPSTAGSIVVPSTAGVVMPTTNYANPTYTTVPMSAPVMVPSYHRPASVVVPTTQHYEYAPSTTTQHYGYAPSMPYYGAMAPAVAPTVVLSSRHRSSRRHRRHSVRFFDF